MDAANSSELPSCFDDPLLSEEKGRKTQGAMGGGYFESHFNRLKDELVIEILHRLPIAKDAIRCQLMSKKWYSLITSSRFIACFKNRHVNLNLDNKENPVAIFRNYITKQNHHGICTISNVNNMSGLDFACLPEEKGTVSVVASSNDLIICCASKSPILFQHYIFNPFTMKWVALPSVEEFHYGLRTVGFVCENDSSFNDDVQCRYRVVRFCMFSGSNYLSLKTYCSESGQWVESAPLEGNFGQIVSNVVSYKGKLWWYTGKHIVAYDPFNPYQNTTLLDGSAFQYTGPGPAFNIPSCSLGICQGSLRLMRLAIKGSARDGFSNFVTVWELKDDGTTFELKHDLSFKEMDCEEDSFVQKVIKGNCKLTSQALSLHPANADIMYWDLCPRVVSCNMRTKKMKVVANPSDLRFSSGPQSVVSVVLQCYPTGVPATPICLSSIQHQQFPAQISCPFAGMMDGGSVAASNSSELRSRFDKRRKIEEIRKGLVGGIPEAAYSSELRSRFNDLNDELVIEILLRLPKADLTINCELVCKRWYSLISSSPFIHRFINHHANLNHHQNPAAIIINYFTNRGERGLHIISDQLSDTSGFLFSYLPEKNTDSVSVIASFKDLVIYRVRKEKSFCQYYICNPFKMKWFALPLVSQTHNSIEHVGLVFEEDSISSSSFNDDQHQHRFRVVCMHVVEKLHGDYLIVKAYCSETKKWNESAARLGTKYCPIRSNVVGYKGKLWWYTGKHIAAYDPFNPNRSTLLDASVFNYADPGITLQCLGVSRGILRFVRVVIKDSPLDGFTNLATIWELKEDDAKGEWSLEHDVCFDQMDCEHPFVKEYAYGSSVRLSRPLSIHPTNGDIVYCDFNPHVVLCNMRTRRMDVVSTVRDGTLFGRYVFPVVHQ